MSFDGNKEDKQKCVFLAIFTFYMIFLYISIFASMLVCSHEDANRNVGEKTKITFIAKTMSRNIVGKRFSALVDGG